VRYLGNRSSGKMGVAIAAEAARRGAAVTLVLGPTRLEPPAGVDVVHVRSAAEMHAGVMQGASEADVIVMAAAVADYTPAAVSGEKVKKQDGDLTLRLVRTRDILRELGERRGDAALPLLVGFAAETNDVVARAREKLTAKRVDLIVANDVSRRDIGFEADANEVTLVAPDGDEPLALAAKSAVAHALWDRLERLLAEKETGAPRQGSPASTSTPAST
jgi:phosphopantothenoylcysteine decarboxylase/phosphopantothenate--cysteine ligase